MRVMGPCAAAVVVLVLALGGCADSAKVDQAADVFTTATTPSAQPGPAQGADDAVTEVVPLSPAAVEKRSIDAAGLRRDYILSLPEGARQRQKLPLILVFHGFSEDAATIQRYSELDKADALVVYMQGREKAWAPAPYAKTTGEQDLAFVDAVREQLVNEFSVDTARVFASGLSNGGGFAAYVGCQRPQDFTAVATVSAAFYQRVSEGCSAIPIKHIDFHGTADPVINYAGGQRHGTVYESTEEMITEAAERNRCNPHPEENRLSPTVVEQRWLDCDAGLSHYRIEGGPHVWPGGQMDKSGTTTEGFATRRQLEFFGVPYQKLP